MQGKFGVSLPPDIVLKVEELADALGCTRGTWVLELRVQEGRYLNAYLHHGPIRVDEINELARDLMRRLPGRDSSG